MSDMTRLIRDSVDRHAHVDVDPARLLAGAERRARTHRRRTYAAASGLLAAAGLAVVVTLPTLTPWFGGSDVTPAGPTASPTPSAPDRPAAPMATRVAPLDEEALDIDYREFERLTLFAQSRPAWFAGAWYSTDGTLNLAIKAGAPAAERRRAEALPDHGRFTLVEVTYSFDDLQAGLSRIDFTRTLPAGLHGKITSLGLDIPANRVSVGFIEADLAARQALYDLLGPMAIAEEVGVAVPQPGLPQRPRATAP